MPASLHDWSDIPGGKAEAHWDSLSLASATHL